VLFSEPEARPKMVHAATAGLAAGPRGGPLQPIRTAAFGEQIVSFYSRGPAGTWVLSDVATEQLKNGGYVELAGVSGSAVDLTELELQAADKLDADKSLKKGDLG
jgi:hypothetical protein